MKLIYDGKVVGNILGGNNLTIDECCKLCGIDPNEQDDGYEYVWDFDLFTQEAD